MDNPLFKLVGISAILAAWRELHAQEPGTEYVFIDEVQLIPEWGTWVKHQVDFGPRRLILTGSAMTLNAKFKESGVGRWHICKLSTLSFYEYIRIKNESLPQIPMPSSLLDIFDWQPRAFVECASHGTIYTRHFHEYILRGGFPQTALVHSIDRAQQLIREDIIDKVLKRDMTAIYGVRRILELEQVFLYLCKQDGCIFDAQSISKYMEISRQTVDNYIELFEATHLIYKLPKYANGKQALRSKPKIYLADASIASAIWLRGENLLEDSVTLGKSVETTVFKHLFARYYNKSPLFFYWQNKEQLEVDFLAELNGVLIPFEVKYRAQIATEYLQGIYKLLIEKSLSRAYVVTKNAQDFGMFTSGTLATVPLMRVPAPFLCYWLGAHELRSFSV